MDRDYTCPSPTLTSPSPPALREQWVKWSRGELALHKGSKSKGWFVLFHFTHSLFHWLVSFDSFIVSVAACFIAQSISLHKTFHYVQCVSLPEKTLSILIHCCFLNNEHTKRSVVQSHRFTSLSAYFPHHWCSKRKLPTLMDTRALSVHFSRQVTAEQEVVQLATTGWTDPRVDILKTLLRCLLWDVFILFSKKEINYSINSLYAARYTKEDFYCTYTSDISMQTSS